MTDRAVSTTGIEGYSGLQITLHWTIVVLVVVQFISHDAMEDFFDGVEHGTASGPPSDPMALTHVVSGLLILLLILFRLAVRLRRGAPALPADLSPLLRIGAKASHHALYALLVVIPLAGIAAVATGSGAAGGLHATLVLVLWVVVGLHVLAALYHGVIRRDGVFSRIFVPRRV